MYSYVREHFIKVTDDRLVLLNVYRTLHMVIPESSPLSGALLLELLEHAGNTSSGGERGNAASGMIFEESFGEG